MTLVPALHGASSGRGCSAARRRSAGPPAAAARPAPPTRRDARARRLRFAGLLGALRASRRDGRAPRTARSSRRSLARLMAARPVPRSSRPPASPSLGPRRDRRPLDRLRRLLRPVAARATASRGAPAMRPRAAFMPGIVAPAEIVARAARARRARRPRWRGSSALIAAAARDRRRARPGAGRRRSAARFVVVRAGGAARYVVLLRDEPTGAAAIAALRRARRTRMPALVRAAGLPAGARVSYARRDRARARDGRRRSPATCWRVALAHRHRDASSCSRSFLRALRRPAAAARRQRAGVRGLVRAHRAAAARARRAAATSSTTCRSSAA